MPQSYATDPRCACGPHWLISESQPNACTLCCSATAIVAVESVFCISTSAPRPIRVSAACRSLPGSNQLLTHTTFTVVCGATDFAPSANASILRTTSGIGTEPTKPSVCDFDT